MENGCTLEKIDGLPTISEESVLDGDYDKDGSNTNTDLIGTKENETGKITLDVYSGEIVFDNLYCPLYVQYVNAGWLVTTVEPYSATFYDKNLLSIWSTPTFVAPMIKDVDGSAWLMSDGNIVFGIPATSTSNGAVVIANPNGGTKSNPKYSIIANLAIPGDAVRAIPTDDENEFWVAINDRLGKGTYSQIIKIDYSGNVNWAWGMGKVHAPTDLHILTNGDILLSE
jgi:hypothetical protein